MRQFQFRMGRENFALIHVSLVPDIHGEQKTKPTQVRNDCVISTGANTEMINRLPSGIYVAWDLARI